MLLDFFFHVKALKIHMYKFLYNLCNLMELEIFFISKEFGFCIMKNIEISVDKESFEFASFIHVKESSC